MLAASLGCLVSLSRNTKQMDRLRLFNQLTMLYSRFILLLKYLQLLSNVFAVVV